MRQWAFHVICSGALYFRRAQGNFNFRKWEGQVFSLPRFDLFHRLKSRFSTANRAIGDGDLHVEILMRESPLEIDRELVLHPNRDEADRETVRRVIRRVTIHGIVHHQTDQRGAWRVGRSPKVGNSSRDFKTWAKRYDSFPSKG